MTDRMTDHDEQILDEWARHPGWEILNRREKDARDERFLGIAKKLASSPPGQAITAEEQHEAIFYKGWFRGRRDLINNPRLKTLRPSQGDDDS